MANKLSILIFENREAVEGENSEAASILVAVDNATFFGAI